MPLPPPDHPADEVAAHTEASVRYGKEIPWAAMCFARPTPWDGAAPLVVGVSKAATGCEVFGVVLDGAWADPADALAVAVPADAWKALGAADQETRLRAWADTVTLAFTHPGPAAGTLTRGRDGSVILVWGVTRRDGRDRYAADVTRTLTFDRDRHLTSSTEQVVRTWETSFYSRAVAVEGLGGTDGVEAGLRQVGGGLQRCVDATWQSDWALDGHVQLGFSVRAGQVATVAQIDDTALPESLIACMGSAIRRIDWPDDATGGATWSFIVERRAHETPAGPG